MKHYPVLNSLIFISSSMTERRKNSLGSKDHNTNFLMYGFREARGSIPASN